MESVGREKPVHCLCFFFFTFFDLSKICQARPGFICEPDDICTGQSICIESRCQCQIGFKISNGKCTAEVKGKPLPTVCLFVYQNHLFRTTFFSFFIACAPPTQIWLILHEICILLKKNNWILVAIGESCSETTDCMDGICMDGRCLCAKGTVPRGNACVQAECTTDYYSI